MDLKRPLPHNRSYEQIKNHYLVEKSIAERLKKSNREERKLIFASMYQELFSKVPDHPRLSRRQSSELTSEANKNKFLIVNKYLHKTDTFVEFAPGDCKFVFKVAEKVKRVYGVDISDQRNPLDISPENFELIVYDGYDLDKVKSNTVDLVFSDQLIEHFHPQDTKLHFELVHRILKDGGKYIFQTPHLLSGPHDVSLYFSYEAEGFHLKEWTYTEIKELIMNLGYSKFHTYWTAKGIKLRMPYTYFAFCELVISHIPKRYRRYVTKFLIPSLSGVAIK